MPITIPTEPCKETIRLAKLVVNAPKDERTAEEWAKDMSYALCAGERAVMYKTLFRSVEIKRDK